ncbi:virB8 family protein [Roseitranquillus sediminis]|uniref:virB8 family protein n=1 Tax=Roseitranquillus sediminis TaxID=2809051 RepID=UPI001D0C486A|nr:type IV secretion system protein [Roseitranquillus sediminis]MBM9595054.1 type IV secretion system protein [Roseitranquillus sediminis]
MAQHRPTAAAAFEDEVFFSLRRQRTLFGWLAGSSLVVALGAIGTLAAILPLKEVRPYVVMVDRTTGEAEQVVAVRPTNLTDQEAVREAELVRYITDRETYDATDNAERIPRVNAMSEGQAQDSLRTLWTSGAETYPPDLYGRDTLITVRVRSVSVLDADTAQVRFTRRMERPGLEPVERDFVATVGFEFRPRIERNLEQVWHNPLGFTVTGYRVDAETLAPREN